MGESFLALRLHHLRSGSVTDSRSAQTGPHSKTKGCFYHGVFFWGEGGCLEARGGYCNF